MSAKYHLKGMAVLDMDGTLQVGRDGGIQPRMRQTLDGLTVSRIGWTIGTGRTFPSLDPVLRRAGMRPALPIIVANGAATILPDGSRTLAQQRLQATSLRALRWMLQHPVVEAWVATFDPLKQGIVFSSDAMVRERMLTTYGHIIDEGTEDVEAFFERLMALPPIKLDVIPKDGNWQQTVRVLAGVPDINVLGNNRTACITDALADKGTAALWLAGYLGVPRDCILAAGNDPNDVPLFQNTGFRHRIAVGEAPEELCRLATERCASPAELAERLRQIYNIR